MEASQEFLDRLVANPSEGLNVEIKGWIDPGSNAGIAKIAIGCMALRNRNGGYLIIGFDDKTLEPNSNNMPEDIESVFHTDSVQAIVSKYASIPFEVTVAFGTRSDGRFPVIIVEEGITVPVAAKRPLGEGKNQLIKQDAVYFRTLRANGTPSSAPARADDWRDIVEICFDNREADIGRFLRRHLGPGVAARFLATAGSPGSGEGSPSTSKSEDIATLKDRTFRLLDENEDRREKILAKPEFKEKAKQLERYASWSVMLVFDPYLPENDTSKEFLNTVASANPQYTGWPVWLDARGFRKKEDQPRKSEKGWDTVIINPETDWGAVGDFYRIHGRGEFYQWRVLQDDTSEKVAPFTVFDPSLMVFRVAETIAVGLAIARALERGDSTTLSIAMRWKNLSGRTLDAWTDRRRYFSSHATSYDDAADGYVEVSADTPPDAIAPYVQEVTRELFGIWGGFEYPLQGIEQMVQKLLTRT